MKRCCAALAATLFAVLASAGVPATQAASTPEAPAIDVDRLRAHVAFLADDLLEGRGTGTRGGDIAGAYIATQFALAGLQPAGDHGTYFQKVALTGVTTLPDTSFALEAANGSRIEPRLGDDFVVSNQTQGPVADIEAPIVFVGYGIEAPEYGWNDYRDVDVRGKVVLIIVNEPPSKDPRFFNGEALTYYGRWTYKFEQAARQGAVGALVIHRTDLASYPWRIVQNSWSGEEVYLRGDPEPKLAAAAWIQEAVARQIFAQSGLNVDAMILAAGKRGFHARELPVRLRAHILSRVRQFDSNNVLGLLPGSEPGPVRQAMVYTAHYDHLGMDPGLPGHQVYNGAVDNGTGCAIVMELARVYGASAARPPQPVLFAAVTGEEKGLLGSKFLGRHLPLPAGGIALDLNFDQILPIGRPESINISGAERTTIYPVAKAVAATFGLAVEPDPQPNSGHYYRSDHFSFARVGIPAFSVTPGFKFAGHDRAWGQARFEDFDANRYHSPADVLLPDMDFASNAVLAQFGLALGWRALTDPAGVEWLPGEEFLPARQRSRQGP